MTTTTQQSAGVNADDEQLPDLRVLFCIGVLPDFYAQPAAAFDRLLEPFAAAFNDLGSRYGIDVLGTLDDIHFQNGPSSGYPWTCYILAAAPDHHAVQQVVGQLMDIDVDGYRMWRFAKVEARIGPPLDFGTS